jgi:uncharacterized protein YbcI
MRTGAASALEWAHRSHATKLNHHAWSPRERNALPRAACRPRTRVGAMIDDAPARPVDGAELTEGSVTASVSNEMVRIYKELFGRGPTRTRTAFAGPDVLICTLENSFTPAERTLAEMGEHQRLRDVRLFFQYAREQDFRSSIEAITGRKVRAFISGTDTRADISAEVFYFEPE